MKNLQEVNIGQLFYTIKVFYTETNDYKKIIICSRRIYNVSIEPQTSMTKLQIEKISKYPFFGSFLHFKKELLGNSTIIRKHDLEETYYCFSEGSFLSELKQLMTRIKPRMKYYDSQDIIGQYYNQFIPDIMNMVHCNKTVYVNLGTF